MSSSLRNELRAFALIGIIAFLAAPPAVAADQPHQPETKATAPSATKSGGVAEQAPPFSTASGFSHAVQKWSGLNWLTNHGLSTGASLALSARTLSPVSAHIETYNFTDLFSGKFKCMSVQTNGGKYGGIPLGKVHVAVDRPFQLQYFRHKNSRAGLKTPILLNMDGTVSERDFAAGLKSKKVASGLRFMKLDLPGLGEQRLQVLHPQVDLQNGKVQVDTTLITAGAIKDTGIQLRILATPVLEKERYIKLTNMDVSSKDIPNPKDFSSFLEELFNPLVDFGRMDRQTHAFRLSKLDVSGEHVSFAGRLLLAPRQKPEGK